MFFFSKSSNNKLEDTMNPSKDVGPSQASSPKISTRKLSSTSKQHSSSAQTKQRDRPSTAKPRTKGQKPVRPKTARKSSYPETVSSFASCRRLSRNHFHSKDPPLFSEKVKKNSSHTLSEPKTAVEHYAQDGDENKTPKCKYI